MPSEGDFHPVSDEREVLLQGEFTIHHGKNPVTVDVSIGREKIVYHGSNGTKSNAADCIALSDVIGCRSFGGDAKQSSGSPKLTENVSCLRVFAYRYDKKPANGGVRRRLVLNLFCHHHDTKEENVALVERWRLIIQSLLRGVEFSSTDDLTEALLPPPPYYLVCINPHSGKGKAGQVFKQHVKPLFEEAGVTFKAITTERQGHGIEIAKSLDLKEYSGIIIVSGDGLMYEFIQGFKEREDREEAFKIPFGLIPGGSGNALCAAILSYRGEQMLKSTALHAAFTIVKGKPHPKDLVRVENTAETLYAFLAISWGIIADIDIESERFRFLGDTRFAVGAVTRILFLRKVPGRLSFLPIADASKYAHLFQKRDTKQPPQSSKSGDGMNGPVEFHEEQGSESSGKNANQNANASSAAAVGATRQNPTSEEPVELPPLSEPVPANWTVIEGDFITIVIAFVSHISQDFVIHPGQAPDEGVITLHFMDGTGTRSHLTKMFDHVKTGEYLHRDYSKCKFVRAFRLEPLNEDGILTVDGERVKYGPIQGAMMSQKCHCIV